MQLNILCVENLDSFYMQINICGKKSNVKKPHPMSYARSLRFAQEFQRRGGLDLIGAYLF